MDNKYLNENRYEKANKKIKSVSLIVLIIGLIIGGSLIFLGIKKQSEVNSTYSEESKQSKIDDLTVKINVEKEKLQAKKGELESKNITPSSNYENGEAYDLYIIKNALNPSFGYCSFDEYKSNTLTSKYCSLKQELEEIQRTNVSFERRFNNSRSIPFFMFGGFIIIATGMMAISIFTISKRREILAYTMQQTMPVAEEGIEKIAPTIGKAGASIAKEMAPAYKEVAKEVAKGIKEGINEADEKE